MVRKRGEFSYSSAQPGKAAAGALLLFRAPATPGGSHPSSQPRSPPRALHMPWTFRLSVPLALLVPSILGPAQRIDLLASWALVGAG